MSENIQNIENTVVQTDVNEGSQITQTPKKFFDMSTKDYVFAALSLVVSVLGVSLTLWGGFKLGYTISLILLFVLCTVYLVDKNTKIKLYAAACAVLSLLGSVVFSLSLNGAVNFFLSVVIFCLFAVWFDSLNGSRSCSGDLGIIKNIFASTFGNGFPFASQAVRSVFGNKKNNTLKTVMLGILCAVPVLMVVFPLLISSDAAFEGLISSVFGNLGSAVLKLILGSITAPLLVAYCFALKKNEKHNIASISISGVSPVGLVSFLGAISFCYLTYLFSQLAYFMSAFGKILPEEYTVAQYARRGFFEMSVIAAINFVLVFLSLIIVKKNEGKAPLSVKLITAFISLFTIIIIGTAISKMVLYIGSFGMTCLRVLTSAFMIILGITFLALIVRCFVKNVAVLKIALISSAVVLVAIGYINLEKTIARYNVAAYQSGKLETVDVEHIYDMGHSGIEYLDILANDKNEDIAQQSEIYIRKNIDKMYDIWVDDQDRTHFKRKHTEFSKWNYTRERSYDILQKYLKNYYSLETEQIDNIHYNEYY